MMSIYRNHIACNAPDVSTDSSDRFMLGNIDSEEEKNLFNGALAILDELER